MLGEHSSKSQEPGEDQMRADAGIADDRGAPISLMRQSKKPEVSIGAESKYLIPLLHAALATGGASTGPCLRPSSVSS